MCRADNKHLFILLLETEVEWGEKSRSLVRRVLRRPVALVTAGDSCQRQRRHLHLCPEAVLPRCCPRPSSGMLDKWGPTHSHLRRCLISLADRSSADGPGHVHRPPSPPLRAGSRARRSGSSPGPGPRPPASGPQPSTSSNFHRYFSLKPSVQLSPTACFASCRTRSPVRPGGPLSQT